MTEAPSAPTTHTVQADLPVSRFTFVVGFFIIFSLLWTGGTVFGLMVLAKEVNAGHMAAAAGSLPFYFGMGILFAVFGLGSFLFSLWMLCGRQWVSVDDHHIIHVENRLLGCTFYRRAVVPADVQRIEAELNTSDQWWVKIYMKQVGYIIALGGGLNETEARQLQQQLAACLP